MADDFDLVVIGSGPAGGESPPPPGDPKRRRPRGGGVPPTRGAVAGGEKAAALAAYHNRRVAVIERLPRPGGTMVGGVATTKTMREAALYLTSFRRREVYGVGLELDPQMAVQGVRNRAERVEELLT